MISCEAKDVWKGREKKILVNFGCIGPQTAAHSNANAQAQQSRQDRTLGTAHRWCRKQRHSSCPATLAGVLDLVLPFSPILFALDLFEKGFDILF